MMRTARGVLTNVFGVVAALVVFALVWGITLKIMDVNPYVGKTPADVWHYLFGGESASGVTGAENRERLLSLLWVTLGHASLGFVIGVVLSVGVAIVFTLVKPVEFMFMPLAMLMRTVPLMATAPVIYLVFGGGKVTAALVGTVVVFFPVLVNVTLGFGSASPQMLDVVRVNGGGAWTVMRKVAVPTALPHLLAALRISVPAAITGAMLYEWLFTYVGLGAGIVAATTQSNFTEVWAIVAVITVVAVVLYAIAEAIEAIILAWVGIAPADRRS
ncbi:MAG: ABC transporter permease subunit [Rhodococcus sp.]|nr:ABC transporter permease subunit [Rhodococcus sp. (in: high G+C Gram-positive bacteria)]